MSFHVVLPSNSSFELYPHNKLADFRVRLARPLVLLRKYEVALEEIAYPQLKQDYNDGDGEISIKTTELVDGKMVKTGVARVTVQCSSKDIIFTTNDKLSVFNWRLGVARNGRFEFTYGGDPTVRTALELDGKLAPALGFTKEQTPYGFLEDTIADHESPLMFHNKQMFIYSNIVEPQLVGDSLVPLLRICIPDRSDYVDFISEKYIRPYYIPVSIDNIEEIHIQVRTHTGGLFPFPPGAPLICKLHFRPVR
jgi:hypothetical protein